MFARAASSSLVMLYIGLILAVVIVAAIGILGTRATTLENLTANDELATSTATSQLAREMATAYATGEEAFLVPEPALRSQLLGSLYTSILPATDMQLTDFERLHA